MSDTKHAEANSSNVAESHAEPTVGQSSDTNVAAARFLQRKIARRASGDGVTSSDPQATFDQATGGGGGELPHRAAMEQSFGQDFSGVKSHAGQGSQMESLGAQAATRGETVAFASSSPSKELVAHELTHVVQNRQSGGGGVANKSEVSDPGSAAEVEADAVGARAAAGERVTVHAAPDAMTHGSWGGDEKKEPVKEEPPKKDKKVDAPVDTSIWATALSKYAGGTVPNEEEKKKANEELAKLNDADKKKMAAAVMAHSAQKTLRAALGDTFKIAYWAGLRMLFDGEADVPKASAIAKERFGISFGTDDGTAWSKAGISQTWDVLERLPESQVVNNPQLAKFTREAGGGPGSGAHGNKEATLKFDDAKLNSKNTSAEVGDALRDKNRYDKVVRHEVGHAIDAAHGFSAKFETTAGGGEWKWHDLAADKIAELIVNASGGNISKWGNAGQKTAIMAALTAAVTAKKGGAEVDKPVDALKGEPTKLSQADVDKIKADKAFIALRKGMNDPWYNEGGGEDIGGRTYIMSYPSSVGGGGAVYPSWQSFATANRGKKVSTYQHRSLLEHFAELYATYYDPGTAKSGKKEDHVGKDDGANAAKGVLLTGKDDDAKKYFDDNVDKV